MSFSVGSFLLTCRKASALCDRPEDAPVVNLLHPFIDVRQDLRAGDELSAVLFTDVTLLLILQFVLQARRRSAIVYRSST